MKVLPVSQKSTSSCRKWLSLPGDDSDEEYLWTKLVMLLKTMSGSLGTLFVVNQLCSIVFLLTGRECQLSLQFQSDGLLEVELTTGTTNAESFADFFVGLYFQTWGTVECTLVL